jgi:hypothetical protein
MLLVLMAGCGTSGPQMAAVSGTVTLDGNPVSDAIVEFTPEKGRPSRGVTDDAGRYDLSYTQDQMGAVVGVHKVKIMTGREEATLEGEVVQEAVIEKIPPQYNLNSTLTTDVKGASKDVDFKLLSK